MNSSALRLFLFARWRGNYVDGKTVAPFQVYFPGRQFEVAFTLNDKSMAISSAIDKRNSKTLKLARYLKGRLDRLIREFFSAEYPRKSRPPLEADFVPPRVYVWPLLISEPRISS